MATEEPDLTPPNGRGSASVPAISLWWSMLAFVVGGAGVGLLSGGLYLIFDLPSDSFASLPAIMLLAAAASMARPRNLQQMAIVAAVGAVVGVLAILCYLPFALYAQGLESTSGGVIVRPLGVGLTGGVGTFAALLTLRRFAVQWAAQNQAADPVNRESP